MKAETQKTAWDTLMQHSHLIQNLGNHTLEEQDYQMIEKFFCALYAMAEEDNINNVSFKLFLKKKNPNALPPTKDALSHHIDRTHLQSSIWIMAYIPMPILLEATECG